MPETAESLAAKQESRRNISIEITNHTHTYCLIDPRIHLEGGHCGSPPQPTVRPLQTEVCNFTKNKGKAEGAVGLLTYDLFKRGDNKPQETMVIMFSVPYDFGSYKNWFGLKFQPADSKVDEKLFKDMYYNKKVEGFVRQEANGSILIHEGRQLDLMGTMSPMGKCMMKLEVWDKNLGLQRPQRPY